MAGRRDLIPRVFLDLFFFSSFFSFGDLTAVNPPAVNERIRWGKRQLHFGRLKIFFAVLINGVNMAAVLRRDSARFSRDVPECVRRLPLAMLASAAVSLYLQRRLAEWLLCGRETTISKEIQEPCATKEDATKEKWIRVRQPTRSCFLSAESEQQQPAQSCELCAVPRLPCVVAVRVSCAVRSARKNDRRSPKEGPVGLVLPLLLLLRTRPSALCSVPTFRWTEVTCLFSEDTPESEPICFEGLQPFEAVRGMILSRGFRGLILAGRSQEG